MLERELKQVMAPLTTEVEMMANLQNVKQGLKSDFSDKQIAATIL